MASFIDFLTKTWNLHAVPVSLWVFIWYYKFHQSLEPTLCAGVALGLELTLEPTLCAGVAVGLDLMLVLDPNLDPTLCAGVALGLDLTSEVCPKPGLYTVLWCRTGSWFGSGVLTNTWNKLSALVSQWGLDLRLKFQPKHEARHRFGFGLDLMLKVDQNLEPLGLHLILKCWPRPGTYTSTVH